MIDPFAEDQDIDDMSLTVSKEQETRSGICAILIGEEDTLKSGIALDCRSKAQIERGAKVVALDFDDANLPLWQSHWNRDPNMIIKNPSIFKTVEDAQGKRLDLDYERTFARAHTLIVNTKHAIESGQEIAGFIVDGLDTILTNAETRMREFNDLDIDDGVNFKFWNRRNKYYNELIIAVKNLGCPVYFITHVKEWQHMSKTKKDSKGQAIVEKTWLDGDMEKKTLNKMWQVVDCRQETTADGISTYFAKIREFKFAPQYKNKEFKTMVVGNDSVKYYGLPILRDEVNVEPVDYELEDLF